MISTEGKEDREYLAWYFCQLNYMDCQDDILTYEDAQKWADSVLEERKESEND